MQESTIRIRDARYNDIPKIAPIMTKAYWDNYTMGQLLHPHREKYPTDNDLYWLRQIRKFYWDWRSKFLLAVEVDSDTGKEIRVAGYAHWIRKGDDDQAKSMDLLWMDPRNLLQSAMKQAMALHAFIYPNRAADPYYIDLPDKSYAFFEKDLWVGDRANSWFLECAAVHPDFQGKGIGKKLVRWGLDMAEQQGVCASVNVAAGKEGFYQNCGFNWQYGSATQGEGNPLAHVEEWDFWWRMPESKSQS